MASFSDLGPHLVWEQAIGSSPLEAFDAVDIVPCLRPMLAVLTLNEEAEMGEVGRSLFVRVLEKPL